MHDNIQHADIDRQVRGLPIIGPDPPTPTGQAPRIYQYMRADDNKPRHQVLESNEDFDAVSIKFIVHNEAEHNYLVFESYSHYCAWFATTTIRTLHEVIRNCQPQKLKFDIDLDTKNIDSLLDAPLPVPPTEPEYCGWDLMDNELRMDYATAYANYVAATTKYALASSCTLKTNYLFNQSIIYIEKSNLFV